MTTLEALEVVLNSTDQSWRQSSDADQDALLTVAEAVLSGQLDECWNETDLRQAIEEGRALVEMGVYSIDDAIEEAIRIDDELAAWGQGIDVYLHKISESN